MAQQTVKEKAIELVDNHRNTIVSFLSDSMKHENAKKCALITVTELKNNLCPYCIPDESYYDKVYTEIENL
jgi:uncharacterized protein CbrC (UPF0167 family)